MDFKKCPEMVIRTIVATYKVDFFCQMTFCFKVKIQLEFNKDDEVGKSKSLSSLFVCSKYLR